jgi:UDP-2-acetamido-3-amino-2,3-dideoxy-glucuronate N-acetyltransferase
LSSTPSFSVITRCLAVILACALQSSCTFLGNREYLQKYAPFQGIHRVAVFLQHWPVYLQKPNRNDLGENFIKTRTIFFGPWQPAARMNPRAVDIQDIDDGLMGKIAPVQLSNHTSQITELPFFVHETAIIDQPNQVGQGTKIWHFSHILKNCRIGENCNIGQNVVIGPEVTIGAGCKIQNNVSVYQGVTLEEDVFCGPSMVFTNVYNPRANIRRMDEIRPTLVKTGASIGANATIVCGTTIGRYAFIGAGAVVTRDVPDYALMVGNPARQRGWMCACGVKLNGRLQCDACGQRFEEYEAGLRQLT